MSPLEEYISIIHYWQQNPPPKEVKCHKHHIIPHSCGGPDEDWNIVRLPIGQHYQCHRLLPLIYTTGEFHKAVSYAWMRVSTANKKFITEEEYVAAMTNFANLMSRPKTEEEKRKVSESVKAWHAANPRTDEIRQKLSEAAKGRQTWLGRKHSEESKRKMSEAAKKRPRKPLSEETKRKIGDAHRGKPNLKLRGRHPSEETRKRMSDAAKIREEKKRRSS